MPTEANHQDLPTLKLEFFGCQDSKTNARNKTAMHKALKAYAAFYKKYKLRPAQESDLKLSKTERYISPTTKRHKQWVFPVSMGLQMRYEDTQVVVIIAPKESDGSCLVGTNKLNIYRISPDQTAQMHAAIDKRKAEFAKSPLK